MKLQIDYKVPGGKLIRIDAEIQDNLIKEVRITGDFFIHPEESITLLEKSIENTRINEIVEKLERVIKDNNLTIIGFEPNDIKRMIELHLQEGA